MPHFNGPFLVIDNDGYANCTGLDYAELIMPAQGFIKLTHVVDVFGTGMFDMIQWVPDPERAILN